MSTESKFKGFPEFPSSGEPVVEFLPVPGLPPEYGSTADIFARHTGVPGHDQYALSTARITLVGAGGLNSWVALGLVRSGARHLTVIEPDLVDISNLARQLYFPADVGKFKANRIIRNLASHMPAGGKLTAVPLAFQEAVEEHPFSTDLLIVGVDNNACRLAAVRYARRNRIPAVFTMLSMDGMRSQCFLQGPTAEDPCLWCALPNLDPERTVPCAAAIISSCFMAGSLTLFFAYRALMGWPEGIEPFNWREADLMDNGPGVSGQVKRRPECHVCGS